MTDSIPKGLIDHLIAIGCKESFAELDRIGTKFPSAKFGDFMRIRPDAWTQIAPTLSQDELVGLMKALTMLEHYQNFEAGSVSPVIWLFRCLPHAREEVELINWILGHTKNEYLPFGSPNHGAKTLGDYYQSSAQIADGRRAQLRVEQDRQRDAKLRKAEVASQRLFGAIRPKDEKAIKALLARDADPNSVNKSGQTALQYAESVGLGRLFRASEPQQGVQSEGPASGGPAG